MIHSQLPVLVQHQIYSFLSDKDKNSLSLTSNEVYKCFAELETSTRQDWLACLNACRCGDPKKLPYPDQIDQVCFKNLNEFSHLLKNTDWQTIDIVKAYIDQGAPVRLSEFSQCPLLVNDKNYMAALFFACSDSIGIDKLYEYPSLDLDLVFANVVKINPQTLLNKIPAQFRSAALYQTAFENGFSFSHVPDKYQTPEMCRTAIEKGGSLLHVANQYKTQSLCLVAVVNNTPLWQIPDEFKTPEFYRAAVINGMSILKVPQEYLTAELYQIAYQNGVSHSATPIEHRTALQHRIAVENSAPLSEVPRVLRSIELCRIAVVNGDSLNNIPKVYRTFEVCRLAIENGADLRTVPYEHRTQALCRLALTKGASLYSVLEGDKTYDLCRLAVENGADLNSIPLKYRTIKLCYLAIDKGSRLDAVPEEHRTYELCRFALEKDQTLWSNPLWANIVPSRYHTLALAQVAINNGGSLIGLPRKIQDQLKWDQYVKRGIYIDDNIWHYFMLKNQSSVIDLC